MIKIKITKDEKQVIFEGRYSYTEGAIISGKPSFHIEIDKPFYYGSYQVFFECDSVEELDEFIEHLNDVKKNIRD